MSTTITSTQKLIDITRLSEYNALLKQNVIDKKFGDLSTLIGSVPAKIGEGENEQTVNNLVDYIEKKVALVNGDATALTARVAANETAIGAKNTAADGQPSNATGLYAYVDEAAAAAITKIVAGASTSYDTLQEIEAWILNNTTGAAKMQSDIKVLQGTDGSTQTKDSNSIPGVKLYIDSLVAGKNVDAGVAAGELLLTATPSGNKVTVASTQKLQDAVAAAETAVQTVTKGTSTENLVSIDVATANKAVKVSVTDAALAEKITGMYTDMQGETSSTVADVETKIGNIGSADNLVAYADAKSAANVAALQGSTSETVASLETKVNYLEVAIASDITALFA